MMFRKTIKHATSALGGELDNATENVRDEAAEIRRELRRGAATISLGFLLAGSLIALAVLQAAEGKTSHENCR